MGVDGFRSTSRPRSAATGGGDFDARAPTAHRDHVRSGPAALQADRRTVGCDRGRLPGRAASASSGRSGTTDYRNNTRRFWNGEHRGARHRLPPRRLRGHVRDNRRPWASINFVTAHDGFTAADLVSYARKHNEANGEDNRDGTDHNDSVNHGVEGPTDDPVDHRGPAPARPGTAGHAAAVDRHTDAAPRRRTRPHPRRQQQRVLRSRRHTRGTTPGRSTGHAPTRRSPHTSPALLAPAPRRPGAAPARVLRGPAHDPPAIPTSCGSAPTAPNSTTRAGTTTPAAPCRRGSTAPTSAPTPKTGTSSPTTAGCSSCTRADPP